MPPLPATAAFPTPRLVLSRCLELDACRYNGALVRVPLVRRLAGHVELIPVCPEVEIGLGVPRAPIRLVRGSRGLALVQPATGRELTGAMHAFAARFLSDLPEVEAFLLKARSPSCGIHGVKVFGDAESDRPEAREAGMFAAAVLASYPKHPVEHEARLGNPRLLDQFLTRAFALADLRAARERAGDAAALLELHRRHEATLEAHGGEEEARRLARVALEAAAVEPARGWPAYAAGFRRLLARAPSARSHERVIVRLMGELGRAAGAQERGQLGELLEGYRGAHVGRLALLAALRGWASRIGPPPTPGYLNPYPAELIEGAGPASP